MTFAGTDGEITVSFSDRAVRVLTGCRAEVAAHCQELGGIVVHADLGDRQQREGIIYHEPCDVPADRGKVEVCARCRKEACTCHVLMSCGHTRRTHPEQRNLLEAAAERDGRVCRLGWPL